MVATVVRGATSSSICGSTCWQSEATDVSHTPVLESHAVNELHPPDLRETSVH